MLAPSLDGGNRNRNGILRLHCRHGAVLVHVHGPHAVGLGGEVSGIGEIIAQQHPQLSRKPLQKQKEEELVFLLTPGANLLHVGHQLGRLPRA
jgi:hypothetical protein